MINKEVKIIKENLKFKILLMFSLIIFTSSIIFNTPKEIILGMKLIILSPSILISDYIHIANLGSAFFNSGLLMILILVIIKISRVKINGPVMAALFTIGGFAFFGKNIFNVWPIILGVFLFSKLNKQPFKDYIVIALFGTAMAPIVSQIAFGFNIPLALGIILGFLGGLFAGFILSILSKHFVKLHRGFNLYNIGFTAGVVGFLYMSIFRVMGLDIDFSYTLSFGNNSLLMIYFSLFFLLMLITGFVINDYKLKGLDTLMEQDGRFTTGFLSISGFGMTIFNMGILGFVSLLYIFLVKGEINGAVVGAIMTVSGFGAFGKHFKNTIFVIMGVYIVTIFTSLEPNSTEVLIAALFGTALAPISGRFGWKFGILAGMIHITIVLNTGSLHGGMNLYNNGLAAGIVASILVPIIRNLPGKHILDNLAYPI